MQAVIFADKNINNFLFKIQQKSFIIYVAESLVACGINELIFITNDTNLKNQENEIKKLFSLINVNILTLIDDYNFSNILKLAFEHIDDEFYLINGNIFFDSDISLMKDFVANKDNSNVLSLRITNNIEQTYIYQIDNNFEIKTVIYGDKLKDSHVDGYMNSGRYFLKKSLINDLILNSTCITENDFTNELKEKGLLFGLPLGGKYIDIIDDITTKSLFEWVNLERKAVQFLDRDGVINKNTGYAFGTDLELLEPPYKVVKESNEQNKYTIVITNQSGVARGYYTEDDVRLTNESIKNKYSLKNLIIDDFYYSPYYAEKATIDKYKKESLTRKPLPGMILLACEDYKIDLKNSSMIGDNPKADLINLPYLKCSIVKYE